jgi:hypothetical protein
MRYAIVIALTIYCTSASGQDSASGDISLSAASIRSIDRKINGLDDRLIRQTEKYLNSFARQEEKLFKQLEKTESSKTAELFGDAKKTYETLSQKLNSATGKFDRLTTGEYIAGLDSLQVSLAFLKDAANIVSKTKDIRQQLGNTLNQVNQLQNKLQQTAAIQSYLQSRQQQIKEILSQYTGLPESISKHFTKYKQDIFYYSECIKDYKRLLNDPDRLLRKTLSTLQTIPAFSKFFSKYSMLASLFPTPDNYGTPQALAGLQTRADVQQLLQQQIGMPATNGTNANPAQYLQQQLQQAQGELGRLKDKLQQLGNGGSGSSDMVMPEYAPNPEKTKSVWKRIQIGTDFSTQRSNQYFPHRMDITVTAAYKLSDKAQAGIGLSSQVGFGKSWKQIKVTGEGFGGRLFAEWKAPDLFNTNSRFLASLWFTAGAEMNYTRTVESLAVFKNYSNWTKSALAGISKRYSMSSPLKKGKKLQGNMQVLYDFLHNQHIPPTPALVWRVGWGF